ncbi:hypothetical protein HYFRA_00013752 [Hymenoscyphus fraxineus]|uniref:Uncharacterized protein n=1 Tax=Hymenoscyphus fraxineus TaxID=746836 RepID=A0A9N9Q1P3_9HELO|nr:hypothetical protein HYFRA_00013752 [Hymenoscyphus fraxineus]
MAYRHHTCTRDTITSKSFFQSSDEVVLRLMLDQFAPELERLKRATSIPNKLAIKPTTPSPSQILYGDDYDEVNRTLVGILSLRWLHNRDYETFVGSQEESVKLSKASFEWLCELFKGGITSDANLDYLVTSMIINDLGKDPQLAKDYEAKTGKDIAGSNHDMILYKAAVSGLVKCLDRLCNAEQEELVRSLKLGAEFNIGQLAQAENVPASLDGLLDIERYDRIFEFRFMEQILDLSGAAGHTDWTCAKKTNEPIFQAYQRVYEYVDDVIYRRLPVEVAYNFILKHRAELVHGVGFRKLDVRDVHDRALTRLLCMGGVVDLTTANLYSKAWLAIDKNIREDLVEKLNLDGKHGRPAVQATYFPALLSKALDSARPRTDEGRVETLQSCLRYLRRVLQIDELIEDDAVLVVERDLLRVVNDVDYTVPNILDSADVPEWKVAKLSKFRFR